MITVPYTIRWEPTVAIQTGDVLTWPVRITHETIDMMSGRLVAAQCRRTAFDSADVDIRWTPAGLGLVPEETLRDIIDDGLRAIGRARLGVLLTTSGDRQYYTSRTSDGIAIWYRHLRIGVAGSDGVVTWGLDSDGMPAADRAVVQRAVERAAITGRST